MQENREQLTESAGATATGNRWTLPSRWTRARRGALALAAIPALLVVAPAGASVPPLQQALVTRASNCTEGVFFAERPVSALRAFVPEQFTPIDGSPETSPNVLVDGLIDCERTTVGADAFPGFALSMSGILIQSPDGSPGAHYYMLWTIGNRPDALAPFSSLGVFGGTVEGLRQSASATGTLGHVAVSVPWTYSPYSFTTDVATPFPAVSTITYWHLGPKGLVRFVASLDEHRTLIGAGSIDPAPGSPLDRVLGGTTTGVGVLDHYDYTATLSGEARAPVMSSIRLSVRPRTVAVGRRTRFRLLASTRIDGRRVAVKGASIRLAGHRRRTDRRGRATVSATLTTPGRVRAVATKPGLLDGSATVVARRRARCGKDGRV